MLDSEFYFVLLWSETLKDATAAFPTTPPRYHNPFGGNTAENICQLHGIRTSTEYILVHRRYQNIVIILNTITRQHHDDGNHTTASRDQISVQSTLWTSILNLSEEWTQDTPGHMTASGKLNYNYNAHTLSPLHCSSRYYQMRKCYN